MQIRHLMKFNTRQQSIVQIDLCAYFLCEIVKLKGNLLATNMEEIQTKKTANYIFSKELDHVRIWTVNYT